ncbi:MAG: acetyl-CoA C-acyltransferase, partial [Oligella ureolytica]|nr:acetyl-CoA C-acyltransferase [Oligella ureolytica]
MSDAIVIVSVARTPVGGMMGALSSVPASELGATAIKAAVERAGIEPKLVNQVLMGNVLQAGQGQAPARQAALGAGLEKSATATTVHKVCGSGLKTVMLATDILKAESADVIVAGGQESMSNAPYLLLKGREGYRYGHSTVYDHMALDGLEDAYERGTPMGAFAEQMVEKYGFTREDQDNYAVESLNRANKAIEDGSFEWEITPVTVKSRRGDIVVDTDEQPGNAKPDRIPSLRPAFKKDGTITAANASSISDGAAAVVMMRASTAAKLGVKPLARVVAHSEFAH